MQPLDFNIKFSKKLLSTLSCLTLSLSPIFSQHAFAQAEAAAGAASSAGGAAAGGATAGAGAAAGGAAAAGAAAGGLATAAVVGGVAAVAAGVAVAASENKSNNSTSGTTGTSDIRLKRAIEPLAKLESGLQLYRFQYLWSDDVYVGVMAQDLLANPQWQDAVVVQKNGFYAVNYERLGIRMVSLAEWNHQGIHALVLAPALALAH